MRVVREREQRRCQQCHRPTVRFGVVDAGGTLALCRHYAAVWVVFSRAPWWRRAVRRLLLMLALLLPA